ncbi:hypothetical protein [Natronobacterium gregoryi]|uniref:Uncharacterized protein n=2 Tax=Natronobacterium gregoryi TaxID=44930 RepID=L0AFY7_NATGS|nr:hypothetical protein [Natronobacterium gregoryi]AFZ72828.1 hypothetical protein Natgr_1623 [Natronobacterium gregoryi SP2]ELY69408.1 hypothetical protein C490_07789 [Natronobacterium gregoryi SP2]PLK21166.1 hypothetical protein CYV19_05920 [Natronobacterium gregoryi SP2]SFJ09787.1 hypothetical protein SAMN05443661_11411 [Natronobacterium gregoryi]
MATLSEDDADIGDEEQGGDSIEGGDEGSLLESLVVVGQEIRRSSANAIAVDFLYLFTTAFFATLAVRGFWPAVIAALPIAVLLSFAWLSSRLFFITNVLVIVVTVAVTRAGHVPL